MLEPSFSNSLFPLKVSAFKHRLCTALDRHQHSGLCNKGQALRGTSTGKCARLSFIAVLEIAHPSVCTQHPGKGKYHRIFGAPVVHLQHFALEAAVRAELLAGLEQYLHEGNEGDQLLQAASPWLFLFH